MLDGVRVHPQRHRRAHQPAADRAGDPGGGVLQGRRRRRLRVSMRSKYDVDVRVVASALRRRRPQERRRLHRVGPARARSADAIIERLVTRHRRGAAHPSERMNGVLVVDKPAGPTSHDVVARVRRAIGIARDRPHRHARSAGHRRAAARPRPRDAAGAVPDRRRQGIRRRRPASVRDRHLRRAGIRRRRLDGAATVEIDACMLDAGARPTSAARYQQMPPPFSAKKVGGTPATAGAGGSSRSS